MGGQCACIEPFFGELCEKTCDQGQILKSLYLTINYLRTYSGGDGRAYCSCTPFYQGEQCSEMVCLNGGTDCLDRIHGTRSGVEMNGRCSCPSPYLGYHCEVDSNRSAHAGSRFQRFGEVALSVVLI